MIVCHCNCLTDKDFKRAASDHPQTSDDSAKAQHCRLKKIYMQASNGEKPKCYGCAPLLKQLTK